MTPVEPLEDRERAVIVATLKNIGLRFRCHAQILIGGDGTDDRIICRDPASTDASHSPKTEVTQKRSPRINPDRLPDHISAITWM